MPPAKRRKLAPGQVLDLTFDTDARQEYLSGFHKRKQARIQNARELASRREREERVRERRQIREQRKEELQQHVEAVNAELKKQSRALASDSDPDSGDDGNGTHERDRDGVSVEEAGDRTPWEHEEEYVDEDKYTTVTVEPMNEISDEGGHESDEAMGTKKNVVPGEPNAQSARKPGGSRSKPALGKSARAKVKKKAFRYEGPAARTADRQRQKLKNRAAKARRTGH